MSHTAREYRAVLSHVRGIVMFTNHRLNHWVVNLSDLVRCKCGLQTSVLDISIITCFQRVCVSLYAVFPFVWAQEYPRGRWTWHHQLGSILRCKSCKHIFILFVRNGMRCYAYIINNFHVVSPLYDWKYKTSCEHFLLRLPTCPFFFNCSSLFIIKCIF